jgi:hypothetical protein
MVKKLPKNCQQKAIPRPSTDYFVVGRRQKILQLLMNSFLDKIRVAVSFNIATLRDRAVDLGQQVAISN